MNSRERNHSLDIMRILAVLAVMMIHVSTQFVYTHNTSSIEFVWGNIFYSISLFAVPMFVMISGALLLDEDRVITIRNLFCRNIKNITLLLFFWSALYAVLYRIILPLLNGDMPDFSRFFRTFLFGHYHMWYMYMMIGLYLITPFLREFVKKKNKHLVLLFIALSLLSQFTLPLLRSLSLLWQKPYYIAEFIEKFYLGFFAPYVTYYLTGWYITHIGIDKKWILYGMGFLSLLIIIGYVQSTGDYTNIHTYTNLLVYIYSASLFTALHNAGAKTNRIISILSKLSFGVYIVHPLLQTLIDWKFPYTQNPFMYILCYFIIISLLSFGASFIAAKIPLLKKAFRM